MMYLMMKTFVVLLAVMIFAPIVIEEVSDFMEFEQQSVVLKPEGLVTIEEILLVDEQPEDSWWKWWEETPVLGNILSGLRKFIGFLYENLLSKPLEAMTYFSSAIARPLSIIVYLINFMVILSFIIGIRSVASG